MKQNWNWLINFLRCSFRFASTLIIIEIFCFSLFFQFELCRNFFSFVKIHCDDEMCWIFLPNILFWWFFCDWNYLVVASKTKNRYHFTKCTSGFLLTFTSFIFDRYSKIDFTLEFWGVVEDKKNYNFEKLLNTRREKNQFFVIENIFSHPPRNSPNWGNKKGRRETNKFINKRLIPCCCEIKISKNIRIYYIFCSQPKRW